MIKTNQKSLYAKYTLIKMFDVPLEFEVWARIVKDSEGNDIQVFVKEDKGRGVRRDSSFYFDGYWRVIEKDDVAKTIKSRTSLGIKILRLHDNQWRLTNKTITDKDNNALVSERYVWQNGRLVKMIENGMERVYTYGKTLQDIVKVTPSDEGLYFHPGYDNSVGMMPDENDPMYKYFALDPYGRVYAGYKEEKSKNLTPLKLLQKIIIPTSGCGVEEKNGMPRMECTRPEKKDTEHLNKFGTYPSKNLIPYYGYSEFNIDRNIECECDANDGNFHVSYNDNTIEGPIIVFFSAWSFNINKNDWVELCWSKGDIQATYNHEVKHIENARKIAKEKYKMYMPKEGFKTKEQCFERGEARMLIIYMDWLVWKDEEILHKNTNPKSPNPTGTNRKEIPCPK